MPSEFIILISVVILGFGVMFYLLSKKQNQSIDPTLLEWIKSLQSSLQNNSAQVTKVLQENSRQLNDRLDRAAEVMRDVNREVGKMSEIGRNMQELQDYLKSPKLRGNLGEQVLKDLIQQIFPKNSFHLQYQFKSGEKVDAAIKTDAGILSIDSKFPLENFQRMVKSTDEKEKMESKKEFVRDVKKHIDAISKKYILPDEGTMDFALMYVPSESVFYELVNIDDILDYAREARVYIVSPSTLYAHLQTILLSFEGKKIEERGKEVFRLLRALQIDHGKVNDSLDTLGKHLTNASSQYTQVVKGFTTLGDKLSSTKNLEESNEKMLRD
ncbi:MAG TPA: DNA recombination protein RmuC [Patescibacteria group bacterium]